MNQASESERPGIKDYFTPASVAAFMVKNSQVRKDAKIIDPAAGDGVFIRTLLEQGYRNLWAIEVKDDTASQLRRGLRATNGVNLLTGDALGQEVLGSWSMGSFDVAIGNPPFSHSRYKVEDEAILSNYELARPRQAIEVLFLERFVQLVRPSGLVRIILPMSILSNTNLQYVRDFILENLWIEALVGLPRHTFGGTSAKTAILFGQKRGKSWRVPGKFWRQEGVRLVKVDSLKSVADLAELSIYDAGLGIQVSMDQIVNRMDPDYHFASAELCLTHQAARVRFEPLSSLAEVRTGFLKYGDASSKVYSSLPDGGLEGFVRLIRAKNLSILGFCFDNRDFFISRDDELFRRWARVEVGEVLVVRVGAGCVGRAAAVIDERHTGQADDWMLIVKPKSVNPSYLAFYLNSSIGKAHVLREAQGTGTLSISKGKLLKVQVPMLPQSEQEQFEAEVAEMYDAFERAGRSEAEAIFLSMEERLRRLVLRE